MRVRLLRGQVRILLRLGTELVRLSVVLLTVSCASGATVAPRPAADSSGDRADPCDICVLQEDEPGADDDGCPEPDLRLGDACTLSSEQEATLSRIVPELVANTRLTSLRVVSGKAACANAVSMALQRRGMPSARIEVATRGSDSSVSLEVGVWDGRHC